MSYYCVQCLRELSELWVEAYFYSYDHNEGGIMCYSCYMANEQLNKGRDDE